MTNARLADLKAHVARFDLDKHPFYVAWRMGTLPVEKLQTYAHQYGRFVGGALPALWRAVGDDDHARYEEGHARLWGEFALAVDDLRGATGDSKASTQVDALVGATSSFSDEPEALGALYAFEAQQPGTAQTKLDGLKQHYPVGPRGEAYFATHAGDAHETTLLEQRLLQLDDAELDRASTACAMTSAALWLALDGVLAA
jgi:pyrroloquinoline-quinone synthase